ncbi:hypothetical protein LSTR_LSTR010060 [Laodelphax striatellus]|uniref:Swi5-dependent recombination DNA repair protein 1 homolog n=1 Tax=Laodelphax striatellus TaxID=195883 RepID=A0A482WNA9_LAOST|nr:hypothetical protein LSTR_LSTR010060 [Laodelphax striatellus]
MESCDKVSVTPSSCKDFSNKCINKTLLTPCRSVGLKRRSGTLKKNTQVLTDSPIVHSFETETPTVLKSTPNSTISRKHLGSSFRDKLKKRKLELSLKENDDLVENNSSENSETKNIENVEKETYSYSNKFSKKTKQENDDLVENNSSENPETKSSIEKIVEKERDSGFSCSNNSSKKTNQDDSSYEIFGNTSAKKCSVPSAITNDMLLDLVDTIRKKELKLRSLEETHIYAKKHNPEELRELIIRWKLGCQDALREIQSLINGKGFNMSMAQVLDQFQVPYNMVNFNADCDEFDE